jgi:hypothetical protein
MLSTSWTNDVRISLLGKRSNALINRSAPAAAKNSRDLLADATPALVPRAKKNGGGTSRASAIRVRRPIEIRFVPFSYFCTCWYRTPIRSARSVKVNPICFRCAFTRRPIWASHASTDLGCGVVTFFALLMLMPLDWGDHADFAGTIIAADCKELRSSTPECRGGSHFGINWFQPPPSKQRRHVALVVLASRQVRYKRDTPQADAGAEDTAAETAYGASTYRYAWPGRPVLPIAWPILGNRTRLCGENRRQSARRLR